MIYAIGDLHLDSSGEKPMDIFGPHWSDHENKIMENWKSLVGEEDLVIIAGDISWALKLEEAYEDLIKIDRLPGRKILLKGNHDYWWHSLKKLRDLGLETIDFIQNTSMTYQGVGIAGSRGWSSIDLEEGEDSHDEKIFLRELNRLRLSLESLGQVDKKIAVLHYPPFNRDLSPNEFFPIMKEYQVDICLYGHLHAEGHKYVVEKNIDGIDFYCVSSDYIDFTPKKIL